MTDAAGGRRDGGRRDNPARQPPVAPFKEINRKMSPRRWVVVPVIAGALTAHVAVASADDPVPTPTPTPTPAATPTADPTTPPAMPITGSVIVTTVTTTITTVNAPIIVIAAPITTTINTTTSSTNTSSNVETTGVGGTAGRAGDRLVLNLTGCGRKAPAAARGNVRHAQLRLRRDARLDVRVNGRHVTGLRLPSTTTPSGRRRQGVALRLRLQRNGLLTIRRPSGRILAVQGCTPDR